MTESEKAGLYLDRDDPFAGMVKIPAGTFQMGWAPGCGGSAGGYGDAPAHEVTISRDFWIGRYPVTKRFYAEVFGEKWDPETAEHPKRFCGWCDKFPEELNKIFAGKLPEGYRFDLPTEAQWEYAAKAGSTGPLPLPAKGSSRTEAEIFEQFKTYMMCDACDITIPSVATFPVNAWGLYGIPGGVWEFCRDLYDDYPDGPAVDPSGPSGRTATGGCHPVLRGPDCIYRWNYLHLYMRYIGARLVIAPIEAEKGKTQWELDQERYGREAREFFEALYPGVDVKPLLLGNFTPEEFAEYMKYARRIRRENFSFEKAVYCIQNSLDLVTLSSVCFCRMLADEAEKKWNDGHEKRS